MSRYKVLMLGWSNASGMTGGLGNACMGLCRALSQKVDVILILPEASEKQNQDGVRIIETSPGSAEKGVIENEYATRQETISEHSTRTIYTDIELDPYFHPVSGRSLKEELTRIKELRIKRRKRKEKTAEKIQSISNSDDLYDDDMLDRVLQYAHRVVEIAKNLDFDIIHAHDWMTFLAGIYLKNATGKPLLLHVHSLDYDRAAGDIKSWVFDIERYSMSKADLVVPVSNYTAGIIYSRYGLSSNKVYTIHNGIAPVEMKVKTPSPGEKTVLFAGRITGQKGWRYFLEIAMYIAVQYENISFIMAGDGPQMDDLTKSDIVESLGDKITIAGHVSKDRLKELFSASDVYVMPSVSEPFGMTALEAVQQGTPVVLSKRSGVTEVLPSAPNTNFTDTKGMARLVLQLLKDEKLYLRTLKKLQREVAQNTVEKSISKLLTVYKKLLKG